MSEGLRKKIVFASLPLAIVWAVFSYSGKKSTAQGDTPQVATPLTVAPIMSPHPVRPSSARLINIAEKQAEPWGADPFRTRVAQPAAAGTNTQLAWTLGGIIYSHHNPLAFINKQMVRTGDRVDKATVVSISKKTVVLDYRGRQITLKLSKG